ncbi:uncharacterized protein RAG0_10835 [Rhynchosporium agropyri]|uniref:2EXR domain-containing protein n=1 Tax=Rhynchosporium agropyri TaxID=914238 RepID=A0A1E1L1F2_9HELO|nr:uncharacterized protein RAG0_10835 [Rhynchosporium agropyri]
MSSMQGKHLLTFATMSHAAGSNGEISMVITRSRKRARDMVDSSLQPEKKRTSDDVENRQVIDSNYSTKSGILVLKTCGPILVQFMQHIRDKEARKHLIKTGAERMGSSNTGPFFHLFTLLPTNVRLQIWALLNPMPRRFQQCMALSHRPLATFFSKWNTPVAFHICHESRNEYLYREDDNANQVTTRDHHLYRRCFPDRTGNMMFFSFEADAIFPLSFRIAEKVVRDNVRTIFIGANPRIWSMGYGITRNHTPHSLRKRLLPQHKLAAATYMTACGCQHQRLGKYRDALGGVYDFKLLRKLPSLERLVVMIKNQNLNWLPKLSEIEQRVRLAIMAAQAAYPDIKNPELQLEYIDNWHTCGK